MGSGLVPGGPQWLSPEWFGQRSDASGAATQRLMDGIRDRVIADACILAGDKVLDLGAGTGWLTTAALVAVGPVGTVIAVDLRSESLAAIPQPGGSGGRLSTVVADVARLPLADTCVQAVLAAALLHHLPDMAAVLAEAARVLHPGGRLSIWQPLIRRRRHNAELPGITVAETKQIDQALRAPIPGARIPLNENMIVSAMRKAGFNPSPAALGALLHSLPDVAAVEDHLRWKPHPGAASPLDGITTALGTETAERYLHAFRQAAEHGPITYQTPVLYLAGTLLTPEQTHTARTVGRSGLPIRPAHPRRLRRPRT